MHAEKHLDTHEQKKDLLTKKDRQFFMELGFTACANFLPWEGHALFGQLMLAEPDQAYPKVGLAYCKMMGGQFEDAHQLLRDKVVTSSTLQEYALALRALAFHLEKRPHEIDQLFNNNKDSLEKNAAAFGFFQILLTSLP